MAILGLFEKIGLRALSLPMTILSDTLHDIPSRC